VIPGLDNEPRIFARITDIHYAAQRQRALRSKRRLLEMVGEERAPARRHKRPGARGCELPKLAAYRIRIDKLLRVHAAVRQRLTVRTRAPTDVPVLKTLFGAKRHPHRDPGSRP
jgi:hypothetical protein